MRSLIAGTAGGPSARERGKLVGHFHAEAGRGEPANMVPIFQTGVFGLLLHQIARIRLQGIGGLPLLRLLVVQRLVVDNQTRRKSTM